MRFYKVYDFIADGAEPQQLDSVRTVDIGGTYISLIRLTDGYFAVADRCPHAGARMGLGRCMPEAKIMCPVHRYQYDIKTGKGLAHQGDYIDTYPVETRKDGVYVGLQTKWWKLF